MSAKTGGTILETGISNPAATTTMNNITRLHFFSAMFTEAAKQVPEWIEFL
ncbi:MAG: hypothetical protein WAQ29_13370 [Nitrososphaeraceae archaeon]